MTRYQEYPSNENGEGLRIGVVVARFNQDICDGLLSGAINELHQLGVSAQDITVCSVPGALEIPLVLQSLAEALAFGQKAGLDMQQVIEVISQGAASSWQMVNRGPTMVKDEFDFGFAVDWMRKDLGLVLEEGRRQGARLPVTALIDQFYADVQAMGGGRLDTSSLMKRLR